MEDKKVVDHKETVIKETADDSATPFLDLVKNQKPHEFGDVVTNELGNMARGGINDIKSDEYEDVTLGEPE